MAIQAAELIENARTPFELNAEPDDDVLLVTDTDQDEPLWGVLLAAARALGFEAVVQLISATDAHRGVLPDPVEASMFASDLTVFVTSSSVVHGEAPIEAQRRGVKLVTLDGLTADVLAGPAASADYDYIYEEGKRLRGRWSVGKRVTITTPLGMALEAGIEGRNGYFAVGTVEEQPEGIPLYSASFPDGEAAISPVEGTANGTVVWDATVDGLGRLEAPIEADVEDGYVTDIRGGRQADRLRSRLEDADHPDAYALGEIAIGLNPGARVTGNPREDRKARGTLHLAVGENVDHGGTIDAPIHVDGVVRNATLKIDGETVVDGGEIVA